MSWQILLSISVVAMSITVLLRRALLKDAKIDPVAYFIVFQGLVGLITGVYALYRGFHLPDIQKYGLVILATMILFAAANILSVQVFRQVDASIYSVFFATSAVWIMLANRLVFHDPLTLVQFVGVVLISLSILILVYKNGVFKLDRGTKLGLFMGFLLGLASTCWVYVSRHSDIPTWNALSFLGPSLLVLIARPKALQKMRPLLTGNVLVKMLLLGTFMGIAGLSSLLAYSKGNVNLVSSMQQTGIILTTILAMIFLHERDEIWRKITSAAVCTVAVILIV